MRKARRTRRLACSADRLPVPWGFPPAIARLVVLPADAPAHGLPVGRSDESPPAIYPSTLSEGVATGSCPGGATRVDYSGYTCLINFSECNEISPDKVERIIHPAAEMAPPFVEGQMVPVQSIQPRIIKGT
jgi:hypothetical protein